MGKQIARKDIKDGLYVYKQDNSKRWYARMRINGKWMSKATKKKDIAQAEMEAIMHLALYQRDAERGIPVQSKRFKHVAELAIVSMDRELIQGGGKRNYTEYKRMIENTIIPLLGRRHITSIDELVVQEMYNNIAEQRNKPLKASTLNNYVAALNRVFDEAVVRGWMTQSQRPALTAKGGVTGERRGAFTKEEMQHILNDTDWYTQGKKQITKDVKALLFDYIIVAVHSGMRPGTEMEYLEWRDITMIKKDGENYYQISVRKGKTTLYTKTRHIIVSVEIDSALKRLKKRNSKKTSTDRVFTLPDGSGTKELGRTFTRYLRERGLDKCADGNRTLYSLRHTYITWQLEEGIEPHILGTQCGTSIEMLQRYYSHVKTKVHAKRLAGGNSIVKDPLAISASVVDIGKLEVGVDKDGYIVVKE